MLIHSDYSLFPTQIASAGPAGGFYTLVAWGVLGIALLIALKACFHDRSKGRARCRHCWYTLPHDQLDPCPECGCKPKKKSHLYRTRRSKRWMLVALLVAIAAGSIWYWPHVQYRKQELGETTTQALVPTTYMIWAVPYTDQKQWLILCYRVSGKSSAVQISPDYMPGSGLDCSRLSAASFHIGYGPDDGWLNDQGVLGIGSNGNVLSVYPQASIWRWQGQLLLDRLLSVATDPTEVLASRLDAYYLYDSYSEFQSTDDFKAIYPLLLDQYANQFAEIVNNPPWWFGGDALDANALKRDLAFYYTRVSPDVDYAYNISYGYAMTGTPAADAVEQMWSSPDIRTREAGTGLMDSLVNCVYWARGGQWTLDRDSLDGKQFAELITLAIVKRDELKVNYYPIHWVAALTSLEQSDSNPVKDDGVINYVIGFDRADEAVVETKPDAFYEAFVTTLLAWIVDQSQSDTPHADVLVKILAAFQERLFDLPPDHAMWDVVLDAADQIICTSEDSLRFQALLFYEVLVFPEEDFLELRYVDHLEERLKALLAEAENQSTQAHINILVEALPRDRNEAEEP